jgi:hypothetical protein
MLDWLVSIQLPEGGFQDGMIDQTPVVPVTFNTGQILMGLARGVRELGDRYLESMRKGADWLAATQEPDGSWRRYTSPFASPGAKSYDAHVAWGLLEATRVENRETWIEAAMRSLRWALGRQLDNGWFADSGILRNDDPLTHAIGYTLRGILEGYRFNRASNLLKAWRKAGDGLLAALRPDGFLPGQLDANW